MNFGCNQTSRKLSHMIMVCEILMVTSEKIESCKDGANQCAFVTIARVSYEIV